MFIQDPDGVFEFLRGTFPYYALVFVPLLIVISPMTPVFGAHEFTVYRMHHFDLHGVPHGCRGAAINVEAKALNSSVYTRRCVVARIVDLTPDKFSDITQQMAGGLLVLLPDNLTAIPQKEQQHIAYLEKMLLKEEVTIPVYFAIETPDLQEIYSDVQQTLSNEKAGTAVAELIGSLTASGYKMVSSATQTKAGADIQIVNVQGKLSGFGVEEQLPTVAIVAHYDAFGIAPALSFGADSNGSGVSALLEIARLLSRLYTSSRTHPRFNVLFLLSGAGKFNFQGTKKWIEDNIDSSEGSLLPDSLYTLCLDSLSQGDQLFMHVSKPPKEGSPAAAFWKELQWVSQRLYPELNISLSHKKINLADNSLAWEHERFSIRRLPAFTLSHLQSSKDSRHNSILDVRERIDLDKLARNVKVIAEALARHLYNLSADDVTEIFTDGLAVQKQFLSAWIEMLSRQARSAQLMSLSNRHPALTSLEQTMAHYLKDIRTSTFKPDKREPEVVFYEPVTAQMNAYRVKPPVFELFLAILIAAYLGVVYLVILYFPKLEQLLKSTVSAEKSKQL